MKIAVEGCCHGELDAIYASLQRLQSQTSTTVDLLLIGGDFQVALIPHDKHLIVEYSQQCRYGMYCYAREVPSSGRLCRLL